MSDVEGVTGPVSEENRVHIFDTTLRDLELLLGVQGYPWGSSRSRSSSPASAST